MVGTKSSGNPNIREISKFSTGPTSEIGKLKTTIGVFKYKNAKINRDSILGKMMEEAGVDFFKAEEAIKQRNLFVIWAKSRSVKELTEIQKLDGVVQILDTEMCIRVMDKLKNCVPLDEKDIKLIRLLKDSLESLHKLKYGEKHLNVNAQFRDIRDLLFEGK